MIVRFSSSVDDEKWMHDVILVMPFTAPALAKRSATLMARRADTDGFLLCVYDVHNEGFVSLVNRVFARSRSRYFGYLAQDAFAGRRWLAVAVGELARSRGGLLAFNDGKWHGELASFGLADRAWAQANYPERCLFYSGYRQHYADTELTVLAMAAGRYCYDPHSVLVEVDWDKDSASVNPHDRALYHRRVATRFDGRVTDEALLRKFM